MMTESEQRASPKNRWTRWYMWLAYGGGILGVIAVVVVIVAMAAAPSSGGETVASHPNEDGEPPDLPGIPRASLLVDQLRREYADNSLVFTQDRLGQTVVALGRVYRVLPDSTIVFRTAGDSGLWCAAASSEEVAPLEKGMWVLLRGKVAGLSAGRVRLERCEFREFFWGNEWVDGS